MFMNRRGSVAIFSTLWLLIVFAVASLSVDGGYWYLTRMREQKAADGAALAGAIALAYYPAGSAQISTAANQIAAANGFAASPTTSVTVTTPSSGPYASNPDAVAVTITQPAQTFFSVAFGLIAKGPDIAAQAVALLTTSPTSPVCMLSLNGTFSIQGNSSFQSPACSIGSDYTSSDAIDVAGNSRGNVYEFIAAGGINFGGNSDVQQATQDLSYQLPIRNPFADLDTLSLTSNAAPESVFNSKNKTVEYYPGTYKTLLTVSGQSSVNFNPGLYIFQNGVSISGQASVEGAGVTFVITGGSLKITGSSAVTLTAPTPNSTYPALNGVLFYMPPPAGMPTESSIVQIKGNSHTLLSGAMYFPDAIVSESGTSATASGTDNCNVLVASQINITGNSSVNNSSAACESAGTPLAYPQFVELVQ